MFTKAPFIRTPQQLLDSIFRSGPKEAAAPSPSKSENKRVWASLTKGKSVVMEEVRREVLPRDPDGIKTSVALTDGERALQSGSPKSMKLTPILHLIHMLERVWRAAHLFQLEGSAEVEIHAKLVALRILQGATFQAVLNTSNTCSGWFKAVSTDPRQSLRENPLTVSPDPTMLNALPSTFGGRKKGTLLLTSFAHT